MSVNIFPWLHYFETGVKSVDDEHREIVFIINEICSCAMSADTYDETIKTLFKRLRV